MTGDSIRSSTSPVAPSKLPTARPVSSLAGPFPASHVPRSQHAMVAPSFLQNQSYPRLPGGSQAPSFSLSMTAPFDRDAALSGDVRVPFSLSPPTTVSVLIRHLPADTTEESVKFMMLFSKELVDIRLFRANQPEDTDFCSAILTFKTAAGAQETRHMLDGKPNVSGDAELTVDILSDSAMRSLNPSSLSATPTASSSAASSTASSRQPSRFNGGFPPIDGLPQPTNTFGGSELLNPDTTPYNVFSLQPPIGNHLTERGHNSGKSMINDAADDDETGELLRDSIAYAENGGLRTQQRRATVPDLAVSHMSGPLSLGPTAATVPASMSSMAQYGPLDMPHMAAHGNPLSPPSMTSSGPPPANYNGHRLRGHNYPPANPADQHPPCNTLYVGNLPLNTTEDELKMLFSNQRGYRRLCFRTKANGPMCFVEFEDISAATKALNDLYGKCLHNSVRGGIRLSFSKNPLGVRSSQPSGQNATGPIPLNGAMAGTNNGFTTASGPPPGLPTPSYAATNRFVYAGNANASFGAGGGSPYVARGGFQSPPGTSWASYNGANGVSGAAATDDSTPSTPFHPRMMGR